MASNHSPLPHSEAISLVEDRLGMSFFDALKWLRRKFGKASGMTLDELEAVIDTELKRWRSLGLGTPEVTDSENDGPSLSL